MSRLMKTLATSRAQSQLFVQRLPADAKFGHRYVGVIVTELLVATGRRDFEGMKAGNCILGAEDWNISLGIKGKGFSPAVSHGNGRITRDIAGNIQRIRILV